MRKQHLALIIFLAFNTTLLAQNEAGPLVSETPLAVRLNVPALVDPFDGNLSAGVEYRLNRRWSVTADLSFIFYSTYIPGNKSALGYIIKPGIRYYTSERHRFFAEANVFYKRAGYRKLDWLGKDCVNGVPAFEQYEMFTFRKQVGGVNVQGGWQRELTRRKRIKMEIYAGLGVRFKWQGIKNDPRACYQQNNYFFPDYTRSYQANLNLPHGLRLVYIIR